MAKSSRMSQKALVVAVCQADLQQQSSVTRNIYQHPPCFHFKYLVRYQASCFLSSFLLTQPLPPDPWKGEDAPHQVCVSTWQHLAVQTILLKGHITCQAVKCGHREPMEESRTLWLMGGGRSLANPEPSSIRPPGECEAGKKLLA